MRNKIIVCVLTFGICLFLLNFYTGSIATKPTSLLPVVKCSPIGEYVTRIELNNGLSVRLLILKHCFERVALDEEREIVKIVSMAASRGLDIQDMGGHFVNGDGKIDRELWAKICELSDLKNFLVEQMKLGAQAGDTIIIYTTGHGSKGGYLDAFGQRDVIMKAFAEAADEADQETLWWQSSCYAAAGLPPMNSLLERQQERLTMITSSDAYHVSYWGDQAEAMKRVLVALAESSSELDQNQDGTVVAGELAQFLKRVKKEDIVFAISPNEPVFSPNWLHRIPIQDMEGGIFNPPDNYIPPPLRGSSQ